MVNDNDLAFIKSSKYRLKIVKYLRDNILATPNDISKSMKILLSQVSRTLSELESNSMVVCTTPNRTKGRIYRLTSDGNDVVNYLEAIDN